jgi:hypothetical protein
MAAGPSFPFLWEAPGAGSPQSGSGAGELLRPFGVGANPSTGDVFVADRGNNRVSEFDIWGTFVRAWGWGVRNGSPELQTCTTVTGCRKGIEGTGPGQFSAMTGLAVDATNGYVYVFEQAREAQQFPTDNYRVQKFQSDGTFLWMLGGGVDKGPHHPGNLCTAAFIGEGDSCGAGALGNANGQFQNAAEGSVVSVGSDGTVYVGDTGRVEEFEPDGTYKGQLLLPDGETGRSVAALTVDPSGYLYLAFGQNTSQEVPEKPYIYKHTGTGWQPFTEVGLPKDQEVNAPVYGFPETLATDPVGNLYIAALEKTINRSWREVVAFTPAGSCIFCAEDIDLAKVSGSRLPGLAIGVACNLSSPDLYVTEEALARLSAYGPPPDSSACPPPAVPPTIADQFAISVDSGQATVKAKINPRFWPDTTYYVEYGPGQCSAGGCTEKAPMPAASLDAGTVNAPIPVGATLPDLAAETTYHFRFVAESGGGGPVFGADPDGEGPGEATFEAGVEGTFTTLPPSLPPRTNCTNQGYRGGRAAFLPDCRAYELVSPLDKEDGDILVLGDITGYPANLQQSADSGDALTYSSYRSFAGNAAAPFTSQYLARRNPAIGWESAGISPPRGPVPILGEGGTLQTEYRAFSTDLCSGWILHDTDPILAPGAVEHYANLYRVDLCGGGYGAVTQAQVGPLEEPVAFLPELQGVSADGSIAVFQVKDKLTLDAVEGVEQLYEAHAGQLSLVSVLPGGAPCSGNASAGTSNGGTGVRTDSVKNAVSADASRIYWSCAGTIYLREAGKSESRVVSGAVSSKEAQFWAASPSGSKALFNTKGSNERLYVFDAKSGVSTLIAGNTKGVLGASEDLSTVYFLSTEALDSGAVAGKPNLYLYRQGDFTYIATLSERDASQPTGLFTASPANVQLSKHSARVTPDGNGLAFMSTVPLTGFDNTDGESGEPDAEVFLYSAITGTLSCPSCNSSGARPSGRELNAATSFWVAGLLPLANSQFHQPRYLSDDGSHLFFESFEPLLPRDENGTEDLYEFEPAASKQACQELGAEAFLAGEKGCLSLISSGAGRADAAFVDASPSGRDVFFTTDQSLVPWDPGLIDVYDAREGGGLPPPSSAAADCEGEACQDPGSGPSDPIPASANPNGVGNVRPKGCPRGKHRVKRHNKSVCAKKRQRKHHHRRAGR